MVGKSIIIVDNTSSTPITQLTQAELNNQLFTAAQNGQSEQVTVLIAQGADLNAADQWGNTALIFSAYNGHAVVVTALILNPHFKATTLNTANLNGNTALSLAAERGHAAVVTALILNPHFDAAALNTVNPNGNTALMLAVRYGHNDLAFSLLNSMRYQAIVATRPNPSFIGRVLFRAPVITPIEASYNRAVTQIRQGLRNMLGAFNEDASRRNLGTANALMNIIAGYYAPDWCLNPNREMQHVLREITNPFIFSRTSNVNNCLRFAFNRLTNTTETPPEQSPSKKESKGSK